MLKPQDYGLALNAFLDLMFWKLPPWLVVFGSGAAGWMLNVVAGNVSHVIRPWPQGWR